MTLKISLIFLILVFSCFQNSFATDEPILITRSPSMENVIFDGKWTNYLEWKQSSHNMLTFDSGNTIIHLRTAHLGDYIYIFIDPVTDFSLDKNKDKATICIDGKNDKTQYFDENDFCFSTILESTQKNVLQGTQLDDSKITMQNIPSPDDFIAASSISDDNDRYTKTPHPSYEFKIPINLIERADNYGIFVSVYDANSNEYFTWPEKHTDKNSEIPPPSEWGDIISPDKSLPELNLPILIFTILIFSIIIVQLKTKLRFLH